MERVFTEATQGRNTSASHKLDAGGYNQHRSKRFKAGSIPEAMKHAQELLNANLSGALSSGDHTIEEAFDECRKHTRRKRSFGLMSWDESSTRFIEYCNKNGKRKWSELDRRFLRRFIDDECRFRKRDGKPTAQDTIRIYLQATRQTSGYMHREYGTVNFAERLEVVSEVEPPEPTRINLIDFLDFLAFVENQCPRLAVGVALQGLAGLRLTEATRLIWPKVDLENGAIEISGETKNRWSRRVIPVCSLLHRILKDARARADEQKSKVIDPHVLLSPSGVGYEVSWKNYSRAILQLLKQWNPAVLWPRKDFRNILPTFAMEEGFYSPIFESYIGHAPTGITARHYTPRLSSVTKGEEIEPKDNLKKLRRHVGQFIDEGIEKAQKRIEKQDNVVSFSPSAKCEKEKACASHEKIAQAS